MNTWHKKELGDSVNAFAKIKEIKEQFNVAYSLAGLPIDMAIFYRYDQEKDKGTMYFSPKAHKVAQIFNAQQCEKPSRHGLNQSYGDDGSLEFFYPCS